MLYCCKPLITATNQQLQKLHKLQNQILRLITGAIKTTPIDSMLLYTQNLDINAEIEIASINLYEKLIRLLDDKYWSNYSYNTRKLKSQHGFLQHVLQVRNKYDIQNKPEKLLIQENPLEPLITTHNLDLLKGGLVKGNTNPEILRLCTIETIETKYPCPKWLHIYTDGSKININGPVGAGIHCTLFSLYTPLGQNKKAFGGEIKAIHIALSQIICRQQINDHIVILSDSKAAIQAITSHQIIQNKEILECRNLITTLQLKHKTLVLQWIQSHCGTKGNEIADKLAKRGAICLQQPTSLTLYHSATIIIKQTVKGTFKNNLQSWTQEKQCKDIAKITPDVPRKTAVVHF